MRIRRIPPKISGILNNCALHACVPELVEAIKYFAMKEEAALTTWGFVKKRMKRLFNIYDAHNWNRNKLVKLDKYQANYQNLKQTFATFYKIDDNQLTWRKFYDLLTRSVNYNQTAPQVIMGPVLRTFIQKPGARQTLSSSEKSVIQRETVISNDGRYLAMYADMLNKYVGEPLGLEICENTRQESESMEQGYVQNRFNAGNGVFAVDIYNDDSHWERTPKNNIDNVVNDREKLSNDAQNINDALRCD